MSLTSSNSSPDDRRTSRAVACSHCRQRRSFCSKDRPACSRCQAAGLVCRYKEENRVRITESRLRILQTKAEAYDVLVNQPKQRQARTDTLNGDNRDDDHGVNTNDDDDYEEQQPFLDRFNIGFTGPGSSDAFLRSLQRLCGLEEEDDDNNRLDMQFTSLFEPGQLPSRRNLRGTDVRLPPLAMARRLFAAQHSYIGSIFAFTNPADAFEQAMTDAYTFVVRPNPDDDDIETCLRYAKVLVVLAFGQLYSINQWVGFRGPPGFGYFANALQFLPDPHAQPSILFVETLALIGYFFQNLNCVASASMYIGMALRMAMSLGLHQEEVSGCAASGSDYRQSSSTGMLIKNGSAQDDAAREHRRRVWWSVYSLDCILAVKSGSPVTIQDEDIGVQPPSWLPEEIDYRPAAVLWHHTRLSHLLGEIHATIYRRTAAAATTTTATRRRPKERLTTLVERLLTKLSDYKRDLPNELRFDRSWLSITSRESVSIMALYHHCISVAVRPLLSHIVQKRLKEAHTSDYTAAEDDESQNRFNWKTGLPRLVIDAIETCVSSAKDVIQMMTLAAERDLVATYGSMDGEHIVSATIVLIMACIALPSITPGEDYNNSSNVATMHAGLRLLRNMGDRGNDHIAARHNRLIAVVQVHSMGQTSSRFVDSAVTSQGSTMDVRAPTSADEPASTDSTFAQPCISSSHGTTSSSLTTIITSNADDTCTMSQFPALDNSLLDELSFYVNNDSMTGVDLTMWEEEGFAGPITITDQAHDGGFSKWSGAGFRDSAGA